MLCSGKYSAGGQLQIGSSSGLKIACRNAVVMSNVKMLECILSANTSINLRIMSTGVEANVLSTSLIRCLIPLTDNRLLHVHGFPSVDPGEV